MKTNVHLYELFERTSLTLIKTESKSCWEKLNILHLIDISHWSCHKKRRMDEAEVISPLILNHGSRWRWMINFTSWPHEPWERTWGRRICGPQSHSGRLGGGTNLSPLLGFEPLIFRSVTYSLYCINDLHRFYVGQFFNCITFEWIWSTPFF
jgi:hypothetical protein